MPLNAMTVVPVQIRNDSALFLWVFSSVWLAGVMIFTGLAIREGGIPGLSEPATQFVLAAFWVTGLGFGVFAFRKPLFLARIDGKTLRLQKRWVTLTKSDQIPLSEIDKITLFETKDSEGDPYFEYRLPFSEGDDFILFEGHDIKKIEADIAALKLALKP